MTPNVNRRGRYTCPFCDHKSWKSRAAAVSHIKDHHPKDAEIDRLEKELAMLERQKPKEVVKEKVVYKEKPEPKYYWVSAYCENCQIVYHPTGIPRGQTVENTPHSVCGNKTLKPVKEIR